MNCYFCINNIENIDYKDAETLRQFTSAQAKIKAPKRTNTCAKHQRKLGRAIKRARFMALLPYIGR